MIKLYTHYSITRFSYCYIPQSSPIPHPPSLPQRRGGEANAAGAGDFADDVDGGRAGALSLHGVLPGSGYSKVSGQSDD